MRGAEKLRSNGYAASRVTPRSMRERVLASLDPGAKRALDVLVSGLLLLLLLPLMIVIALVVKLESSGPVFFRCSRVGYRGRELHVLKFRKMHADAAGVRLSLSDDDRFTRAGRFLARYKLDELPQLVSVLRGDLSLVGPRPEDACFVDLHRAGFSQILSVKPGITGLSQLAFAKEGQILDHEAPVDHYISRILPQKVGIDSFYAENRSITMDVRVLAWTAVAVVGRRDVAVHRDTGRLSVRRPRPLVLEPADIPLSSGYPGTRPEALPVAD